MSNRAIAHQLGVRENAIRKLVGPSKPAESAQLTLPAIPSAAEELAAARVPSTTRNSEDGDRAARSVEEKGEDGRRATAPEAANDDEPVPMSLDRDATDRTLDRQLAYLGLLDDAAPLFREGSSVPGLGVLLALPCLVESGLFRSPAPRATHRVRKNPGGYLRNPVFIGLSKAPFGCGPAAESAPAAT